MTNSDDKKPRVKATKQKSVQLTEKAIDVLDQLVAESGFDQGVVISNLVIGWQDSYRKKFCK